MSVSGGAGGDEKGHPGGWEFVFFSIFFSKGCDDMTRVSS